MVGKFGASITFDLINQIISKGTLQEFGNIFSALRDKDIAWPHGNTLLHQAVYQNRLDIVEYLLDSNKSKNKIDVNTVNNYSASPLHYAALNGNQEICEKLLMHNASLEAELKFRSKLHTPLHFAAMSNNLDIIKLFIAQGADIEAKDALGLIPLDYANNTGHQNIVTFLSQQMEIEEQSRNSEEGLWEIEIDNDQAFDNRSDNTESLDIQNLTIMLGDVTLHSQDL